MKIVQNLDQHSASLGQPFGKHEFLQISAGLHLAGCLATVRLAEKFPILQKYSTEQFPILQKYYRNEFWNLNIIDSYNTFNIYYQLNWLYLP